MAASWGSSLTKQNDLQGVQELSQKVSKIGLQANKANENNNEDSNTNVQEWGFPPQQQASNDGGNIAGWGNTSMVNDNNNFSNNNSNNSNKNNSNKSEKESNTNTNVTAGISGWGNIEFGSNNENEEEEDDDDVSPKHNNNNNINNNNNSNNSNTNNNNNIDNGSSKNEKKEEKENEKYSLQMDGGIDESTQGEIKFRGLSQAEQYHSSKFITFADMNVLNAQVLNAITYMGWTRPSKIQASILPVILNSKSQNFNRDVIGQAHHGSGKTGTFLLNIIEKINLQKHHLQGMVICHTRELATQTKEVATKLGRNRQGLEIVLAVPPKNKHNPDRSERVPSMNDWRSHICIGTPGVILFNLLGYDSRDNKVKYPNQVKSFLKYFQTLVIDEADEFLGDARVDSDISENASNKKIFYTRHARGARGGRGGGRGGRGGRGGNSGGRNNDYYPKLSLCEQLEQIANIMKLHGPSYQTMLFSATFPEEITKLSAKFGCKNPFQIEVAKKDLGLKHIKNIVIETRNEDRKFEILTELLINLEIGQVIVFTNSVKLTTQLQKRLTNAESFSLECSLLTGKMSNEDRDRQMEAFRLQESRILIASNVIARGIDVPSVNVVINYEIPCLMTDTKMDRNIVDGETYMHRVGRTGRYGKRGCCINFTDGAQSSKLLDQVFKHYHLTENAHVIQADGQDANQVEKETIHIIDEWIKKHDSATDNQNNQSNDKPK